MEICLQKNGPTIGSPSRTLSDFCAATLSRQADWERRLTERPAEFRDVEQEIKAHYDRGADLLTAAVLARVTQGPDMEHHVQQVREQAALPLRAPERRPSRVRLLSGLVLWVTTLYCPPRSGGPKRADPTEQPVGLFPELAALGIRDGASPALQATVARIMALSPSIEVARQELRRQGLRLDKKTVRRLAEQLGTQFLVWRQRELLAWREQAACTPPGDELAGCRVAVQIDGGRVRVRENRRARRRKPGQRQKFKTRWREPKALIIFVFDEQGKMIRRHRRPLIDGTLLGPDHLAELVAWHLHRLGAARAETVVFVSDGARWIWDRLDAIIRRAGLDPARTVRVLDWCHAVQHVSRALTSLKLKASVRRAKFAELRTWLKQSRWAEVVAELERLAAGRSERHGVWTEIRYLREHGAAGHLQYLAFRRRGLPCGSGAIESTIRRVINLRLKSNAMYWREENAEAVFALRAALLSNRWEEMLDGTQRTMSRDRDPRSQPVLTGVVLARNEEANIVDCLRSLRPHVAELLLIDMQSTDRTVELARPFVTRVLTHPVVANFDAARNVAIREARFEWLWFLDADERVPQRTGEIVRQIIRERGPEIAAITIPFKSYFCGKWIEHCGWWPG